MNIIGDKYTKKHIYNGIYEYTADEGYHFESCGTNYGRTIWDGIILTNTYLIKKDETDTEKNSV